MRKSGEFDIVENIVASEFNTWKASANSKTTQKITKSQTNVHKCEWCAIFMHVDEYKENST